MADGKEKDAEQASIPASQNASSSNGAGRPRGMVPPDIIQAMTPEHRAKVEKRLKRKIDGRILPAIIIMYILNYIDRYVLSRPTRSLAGEACAYTLAQEQHRRRRACWLEGGFESPWVPVPGKSEEERWTYVCPGWS